MKEAVAKVIRKLPEVNRLGVESSLTDGNKTEQR